MISFYFNKARPFSLSSLASFVFFYLLCFPYFSYSQHTVRVYEDMESYIKGRYDTLAEVRIEKRSKRSIQAGGGSDYLLESDYYTISKKLKKGYWAVEYKDTLMLNMRMIGNSRYAMALLRTPKHIYFRAGVGDINGARPSNPMPAIILGGAIGGAIHGAREAMLRFDYLLDLQTGDIIALTDNGYEIMKVLAQKKGLQEKYVDADMPQDSASYIQFIRELDD